MSLAWWEVCHSCKPGCQRSYIIMWHNEAIFALWECLVTGLLSYISSIFGYIMQAKQ